MTDLTADIDQYLELRKSAADHSHTLSTRELTGRLLKAELYIEHRQAGKTITDAKEAAKEDPRYVDFCRETIDLERAQEYRLAEAEARRLRALHGIARESSAGLLGDDGFSGIGPGVT